MFKLIIITLIASHPYDYQAMSKLYPTLGECTDAGGAEVINQNLAKTGYETAADLAANRTLTFACPLVKKP